MHILIAARDTGRLQVLAGHVQEIPVAGTLEAAIDGPSQRRRGPCVCAEDRDPSLVSRRLRVAWLKAFDGEPPDDTDLGAYQDATEILDCLSASEAAGP